MKVMQLNLNRLLPLFCLLTLLVLFFAFDLQHYLTLQTVHQHYMDLCHWRDNHYLLAIILYVTSYVAMVACFIPFATVLTVGGGLLFGALVATLLSVTGATLGALIAYGAVKYAFRDWGEKRIGKWFGWFERKFSENVFSVLFFLRLAPVFPFWAVNLAAGLLNVDLFAFSLTTFIGIIPGTALISFVGDGMASVMNLDSAPTWSQFINIGILLPLFALALLSLLPILYRYRYDSKSAEENFDKK